MINLGYNSENYKEHIVAFIDLLGFKSDVENITSDDDTKNILELLYTIKNECEIFSQEGTYFKDFDLLSISDSIIITVPYSDTIGTMGCLKLIELFQFSILSLFHRLMRGYVTKGPLYHRDGIIFGDAYTRAYEGEKNLKGCGAIVQIDDAIIQEAKSSIKRNSVPDNWVTIFDRLKEEDGRFYVDYLHPDRIKKMIDPNLQDPLKDPKLHLTKLLAFSQQKQREAMSYSCLSIQKKYAWLEKYIQDCLAIT